MDVCFKKKEKNVFSKKYFFNGQPVGPKWNEGRRSGKVGNRQFLLGSELPILKINQKLWYTRNPKLNYAKKKTMGQNEEQEVARKYIEAIGGGGFVSLQIIVKMKNYVFKGGYFFLSPILVDLAKPAKIFKLL